MPLTKERKAEIAAKYGRGSNDTGSAEVQIAVLTASINSLTEHSKFTRRIITAGAACSYRSGNAAVC